MHIAARSSQQRQSYRSAPPITFDDRDYEGVVRGHDDPLVITAKLNNKKVSRLFIDQGSSAYIIFQDLFEKMELHDRDLLPYDGQLVGFSGQRITPRGYVEIWQTIGDHPMSRTVQTKFLVVQCDSAYNAIIGRPTLNRLEAIVSTPHLCMKFLSISLQTSGRAYGGTGCPGGRRRLSTTTRGGKNNSIVGPILRTGSVSWQYPSAKSKVEAGGIFEGEPEPLRLVSSRHAWYRSFLCLPLANDKKGAKSVAQRRRKMGADRTKEVALKVTELLEAGFIREIIWEVADVRYQYMSFMDAYSGYNQIPMYPPDQEKTAFITDQAANCYSVMPFGLKNAGATY
ncbi:PREDICTED: uncharacterized protein LOC109340804 [Lupinus angustifolius]|uniref:uncharacterized protein LOC109340804 n=1 Tax=Lupinus angustifolius TaxID=3871 RepID=UPI00092E9174|nr:PREDICTED: uncharacterized protein LOC109340804 [Lupinus angustifolius]